MRELCAAHCPKRVVRRIHEKLLLFVEVSWMLNFLCCAIRDGCAPRKERPCLDRSQLHVAISSSAFPVNSDTSSTAHQRAKETSAMFQILLLIARAIGLAFSAAGAGARFGQTIAATDMLAPRYPDEIVVRVQAGWTTYKHPKNPKYELGGYFPDILLWDEEGELIGIGHGRKRKIADGEGQDIFITPTPGNPGGLHQAEYLSVNASKLLGLCHSLRQLDVLTLVCRP